MSRKEPGARIELVLEERDLRGWMEEEGGEREEKGVERREEGEKEGGGRVRRIWYTLKDASLNWPFWPVQERGGSRQ